MEKNNFHFVAVLLDLLYGIEMDDENLEELGLIAWNKIGNKDTKLYRYRDCPNSDNIITLPCNALSIESITTSYEDWSRVTNYSEQGDLRTSFIENHIEAEKIYSIPYYQSGKLIPYSQSGLTIQFSRNYGPLNILYKGINADEDGLPYLSDNEALAIATYLAYFDKYKEGIKTNNIVIINLATNLNKSGVSNVIRKELLNLVRTI